MTDSISVFLPTRKGSERVKGKNTRLFAGISGGLLKIKLQQLLALAEVDEVVLSTNDPDSLLVAAEFSDKRLKVAERPNELALSSTDLIDLVQYVPTVCSCDHILWTHVTSPFTSTEQYNNAIGEYFCAINLDYDSLMSGNRYRNYLWSAEENDIVNREGSIRWPRTQDLKKWYKVDSAVFLASRSIYANENNRIGNKPYLFEQEARHSFDIDYEDDFVLAEMLYKQMENDEY